MPNAKWKSQLLTNAMTNYFRTGVRLVTGLLVFRLTIGHFTKEQFGFWALLWSVFGATVLIDFGLGFTAQKEAAYRSAREEWDELSRLLSTMVWTFVMLGLVMLVVIVVARPFFLERIGISPENYVTFSNAYWIFFGALAIAFPMGLFLEVLGGLQRLDLVNWTMIVGMILNLVLIDRAIASHWPFESFFLIGVVTALAPDFVAYFMVRRLLPKLSLHPRLYHFPSVKGVLSFSLVAYVITLTNLIITRTDQFVISLFLGVAAVAVYQAGYKIAEMFAGVAFQLQLALSPTAAHLSAKGDQTSLRGLLVNSTRLTALIATPGYVLAAVYLRPLIKLLTGFEEIDDQTFISGQILLFSVFTSLLTSVCAKRIMMMCGWEKPLLKLSVTEAGLNLALSVLLVLWMGVPGVAIGTLIPAFLVGWLWVTPLTLKFMDMRFGAWLKAVYLPILTPVIASALILGLLCYFWPLQPVGGRLLLLIIRAVLVMLPVGFYALRFRRTLF